jgi:hypothetical protein
MATCADPIKALRWTLKKAGRLGLKAIDAIEIKEGGDATAENSGKVNQSSTKPIKE